jgi:hypothetical protein
MLVVRKVQTIDLACLLLLQLQLLPTGGWSFCLNFGG